MQGTLDAPPVVILQDQGRMLFLLFLMLGLAAAFGIQAEGAGAHDVLWLLMGFALGGTAAWLFMQKFAPPRSLSIDESGLTWNATWRSRHVPWNHFTGFVVFSNTQFLTLPGCVFSESYTERPMIRIFWGNLGSFGPFWEKTPQEIVDLLNEAHARWAPLAAIRATT